MRAKVQDHRIINKLLAVSIEREIENLTTTLQLRVNLHEQDCLAAVDALDEKKLEISRLSNPISTATAEVQSDLDLLAALQAYSVDNWDGYHEAVSNNERNSNNE